MNPHLTDLCRRLKGLDWDYKYSDDYSYYKRAEREREEVQNNITSVDVESIQEMIEAGDWKADHPGLSMLIFIRDKKLTPI
jgi:hypothetical protein